MKLLQTQHNNSLLKILKPLTLLIAIAPILTLLYLIVSGFNMAIVIKQSTKNKLVYNNYKKVWDGKEKTIKLTPIEITYFTHNGITLSIGKNQNTLCVSYYPLSFYRSRYFIYNENFLKAYNNHFECAKNVISANPQDVTNITTSNLVIDTPDQTLTTGYIKGIKLCYKQRCALVYKIDKLKPKNYLDTDTVRKWGYQKYMSQRLKQAPKATISEYVKDFYLNTDGLLLYTDGRVVAISLNSKGDSFISNPQYFLQDNKDWSKAHPLRICGNTFHYIKDYNSYKAAEQELLYIQLTCSD